MGLRERYRVLWEPIFVLPESSNMVVVPIEVMK